MLFFKNAIHQRMLKKKSNLQKKKIKQQNLFNTDNNKHLYWAPNQHIRMISEGSCDTEDWSNDALKSWE